MHSPTEAADDESTLGSTAHQEVEAVPTDRVRIIGQHEAGLLGMEEGCQAKDEGCVDRRVAALGPLVVARMEQLVLEVREVDETRVGQRAAAPQVFVELVLIGILRHKMT